MTGAVLSVPYMLSWLVEKRLYLFYLLARFSVMTVNCRSNDPRNETPVLLLFL